jgi:hypothetical protein
MYCRHKLLDLERKQPEFCDTVPPGIVVEMSEISELFTLWRQIFHTHESAERVMLLLHDHDFHISTEGALSSAEKKKYPLVLLSTQHILL